MTYVCVYIYTHSYIFTLIFLKKEHILKKMLHKYLGGSVG